MFESERFFDAADAVSRPLARVNDTIVQMDDHDHALDDYDVDLEEPIIDDEAPVPHTPEEFRAGAGEIELPPRVISDASSFFDPESNGDYAKLVGIAWAQELIDYNPGLVRRVLMLSELDQRRLARWCVQQAYERAGLAELSWVAPALAALNAGQTSLPSPFTDLPSAGKRWQEAGQPQSLDHARPAVPLRQLRNPFDNDQRWLGYDALPAIFHALKQSTLQSAIEALGVASRVFGPDVDDLHQRIIHEFIA